MTTSPGGRHHAAWAAGGTLAAVAVLVGVPCVLLMAAGTPWPQRALSLDDLAERLRQPLTDPLVIQLLALVGWTCWAVFCLTVLQEAAWYLRRLPQLRADQALHVAHVETLRAPRALLAACIGALVLALLSGLRTPQAAAQPASPPAAAQQQAVPTPERADERPIVYTVQEGDTLWDIAGRHLGDQIRWPQIYALSTHLVQPDGDRLTNPDVVRAGWRLHLPLDARLSPPSPSEPAPRVDGPAAPSEPPPSIRDTAPPTRQAPPPADKHDDGSAPSQQPSPSATPSPQGARPAGISVGTASLIGVTTAAGIAAAVALARSRARHRGSSRPASEPPPLAPAVRAATQAVLAARRAEQDQEDAKNAGIVRRPAPAPPAPAGMIACAQRDGSEVPLDALASRGGWNLTGPGAEAAARALAIAILSAAQRLAPQPPRVRLVVPHTLSGRLLPTLHPSVPGWTPTTGTAHAISSAQAATVQRARAQLSEPPDPGPPMHVLLLDTGSPQLASLARQSRPGELAVIGLHLGPHLANTAHLAEDGSIEHLDGPDQHVLHAASVFTLAPEPAGELLACFTVAQHGPPPPPAVPVPPSPGPPAHTPTNTAPDPPAANPTTARKNPPSTSSANAETAQTHAPVLATLFGGISLHTSRGEFPVAMKEAAKEFLAILATHPKGLRPETLIDALRLSLDPERAAKDLVNLRRAVRRALRQATGSRSAAFVIQTGDRHRLDPQLVRSDVAAFTAALSQASRAGRSEEGADHLQTALDLYKGPLCDGADYPWADEQRQYFHHKAIDAALVLAEHFTASDPQQALVLLERATAWEPANEAICQRLMRLLHQLGRPEAAQHAYQRLTRHLAELDATPDETTSSLARQLTHR